MSFWEKVKSDVQKGLKEGASKAKEKAEELIVEGKKMYGSFDLKRQVHNDFYELGGIMYELIKNGTEKTEDIKALGIVQKIKELEVKITAADKK